MRPAPGGAAARDRALARHPGRGRRGCRSRRLRGPRGARRSVLHLDVQLHQAVLTELAGHDRPAAAARRDRAARRAQVDVCGLGPARQRGDGAAHALRSAAPGGERAAALRPAARLARRARIGRVRRRRPWTRRAAATARRVGREQFTLAAEAWYAQLDDLVRGLKRRRRARDARARRARGAAARARGAAGRAARLEVVRLPDMAAAAGGRGARGGHRARRAARARDGAGAQPRGARAASGAGSASTATHVIEGGRAHAIDERAARHRARAGRGPAHRARRLRRGHLAPALHARARGRPRARARPQPLRHFRQRRARATARRSSAPATACASAAPGVVFELVAVD